MGPDYVRICKVSGIQIFVAHATERLCHRQVRIARVCCICIGFDTEVAVAGGIHMLRTWAAPYIAIQCWICIGSATQRQTLLNLNKNHIRWSGKCQHNMQTLCVTEVIPLGWSQACMFQHLGVLAWFGVDLVLASAS